LEESPHRLAVASAGYFEDESGKSTHAEWIEIGATEGKSVVHDTGPPLGGAQAGNASDHFRIARSVFRYSTSSTIICIAAW